MYSLLLVSYALPAQAGALVDVSMTSTVGVLLDEIPSTQRTAVATTLLAKPTSFWQDRARMQAHATEYLLVYRNFFYAQRGQLPLPPSTVWTVTVGTPTRTTIEGHDLVATTYTLHSVLVTGDDEPGLAEPKLKKTGGVWNEPFVLPVDPDLLFDRTGYACMDEDGFPDNSVDPENDLDFYDGTCTASDAFCHHTAFPTEDCTAALSAHVGSVATNVVFTRLAWNATTAATYSVGTQTPGVAQAKAVASGLADHRVTYTYIPPDSCAIEEGCVLASGWRRLLRFTASMQNVGAEDLFVGDTSSPHSDVVENGLVEFSACHGHYHFNHYGDFTYDGGMGGKRAFCVESTQRYFNNVDTPLNHPYGCDYQGTAAGWGDDYVAGLDCQWIDITGIATTTNHPIDLKFDFNPDDFLCEGAPILDSHGDLTFEDTSFIGQSGAPEKAIACTEATNWDSDNLVSTPIGLPPTGGYITDPCTRGQIGPKRNCGYTEQSNNNTCTPGASVHLSCTGTQQQVLRLCESSKALNTGTSCSSRDALANATISPTAASVTFTCPAARDSVETGGRYAMYRAPLASGGTAGTVTCTVVP